MTTQELYTKLIAGEITEQKFLYETRRDQNLPFVTSLNNFKDTVQILKNKCIISEKAAKEATGKQEVEVIAKTIDMVNPYEYSRGMDIELGVENEAVGNSEITEDDVLKAQKKVLKNLTKDPNYYSKKRIASMGDSEYEIEVNAKSIKALEKQKGKIIREHGEEYDRVADVNADSTPLEEDDKTQAFVMALDMFKNAKGTSDEEKALNNLKQVSKETLGVELPLDEQQLSLGFDFGDEDEARFDSLSDVEFDSKSFKNLPYTERSKLVKAGLAKLKRTKDPAERKKVADDFAKLANAMGIKIKAQNLLETPKSLDEGDIEELGQTRDAIYEKYAKKYGVDIDELKDRLEAYKLENEAVIKVKDETEATNLAKKLGPNDDTLITIDKK